MRRAVTFTGLIACALLLEACPFRDPHTEGPATLSDGRKFDLYANARCASVANLFRPDRVRSFSANTPLLGGSYYDSASYARIVEPLLATMNQVILQACIQLELKEITPAKYTELLVANSGRYLALLRGSPQTPPSEAFVEAVNATLPEGTPDIKQQQITDAQTQADEMIRGNGITQVQAQVADERNGLAATGTPRSQALTLIFLNQVTGDQGGTREILPDGRPYVSTFALFNHDEALISERDEVRLTTFLANHCCDHKLLVYGFADETGSDDHNRALARIRAANVADFLRRAQPKAMIEQASFGETMKLGEMLQDNRIVYIFAVPGNDTARDAAAR